jgi:hypothetical protein
LLLSERRGDWTHFSEKNKLKARTFFALCCFLMTTMKQKTPAELGFSLKRKTLAGGKFVQRLKDSLPRNLGSVRTKNITKTTNHFSCFPSGTPNWKH